MTLRWAQIHAGALLRDPSRKYSETPDPSPIGAPMPTPPTALKLVAAAHAGLDDDGLAIALALLEATIGPIPRLELMASASWMTPEVLCAPIGDDGRRLALDEAAPAEHYLDIARAALALWLFRAGLTELLPPAERADAEGAA